MSKLLRFLFIVIAASVAGGQQPSWQQIRMGCLYKEFSTRTPVPGTQCNCVDCVSGPGETCVQQNGETAIAIYSQGKWTCTDAGATGTTAVSQWPVYLYAHMQDDNQVKLRLSYSRDMKNWNVVNRMGSFEQPSMRDPSVIYDKVTTKFYFTSSPSVNPYIPIWNSTDLVAFNSGVAQIDVRKWIPAATQVWAPEWYFEEATGKTYIIAAVSIAPDPYALTAQFTCYFFEINLATMSVVGTPTAVTISGSIQQRYFDFTIYKKGSTYHMLYIDQSPIGDGSNNIIHQFMAYATSSSLFGPYTQISPPGTDYFAVTDQVEGMTMVELPNGCVRITYDEFKNQPVGHGTGGRKYYSKFRDTCGPNLFTPASLVPPTSQPADNHYIANAEHGTIIKLDPNTAQAMKTLDAGAFFRTDSYTSSRFGVNTEGRSEYTFSVRSRAAAPGYIQYNEAASIGVDTGTGQYAMLAACGTNNNGCALPFPGEARWSVSHSTDGDEGMMQFNNSVNREASILFGHGIRQFGRRPLSVSKYGDRALWHMGSNKLGMDVQNDNRFFIYNRGLSTTPAVVSQTPTGLQNTLPTGCYGYRLLVGPSPISVTHIGRWVAPGNIGNHGLYILNAAGTTVQQYTLNSTTAGADGSGYYVYTPISNGLLSFYTLSASTAYYIMSSETLNGDQWYNDGTTIQFNPALGSITGGAFQATCGSGAPTNTASANRGFGPLNILYAPQGAYGGLVLSIESQGANEGAVQAHYGLTLGSGAGSAYNVVPYANIDTYGSIIPGPARINMGTGVLGKSDATLMIGSVRAGQGALPTGNTVGWFQNADNLGHTYVGIIANGPDRESRLFFGAYDAANINLNPQIAVSAANKSILLSTGTGLGPELTLNTTTGAIHAQWGVSFGWGIESGASTTPQASIDAYGSRVSGDKRINLGTGVLGTSDAKVMMGSLRAGQGAVPPADIVGWFQNADSAKPTNVGVISNAGQPAQIYLGLYDAAFPWLTPLITGDGYTKNIYFSTGTGLGYEVKIDSATGSLYSQWGIAFGWGIEGGSGTDPFGSIDAFGSRISGIKRINMGTGVLGTSDAVVLAKAVDVNYIGKRGGVNNDLAGFLTLDGAGAGAYTFVNTGPAANAVCTCTVNSSLAACQNFKVGGTMQFRGPAGANVSYVCIMAEF